MLLYYNIITSILQIRKVSNKVKKLERDHRAGWDRNPNILIQSQHLVNMLWTLLVCQTERNCQNPNLLLEAINLFFCNFFFLTSDYYHANEMLMLFPIPII